jgi:AcrR family transcriptional regulator
MRIRNTNKQDLVKAKAIELLVKEGFEGFSMGKLARACSISVATLYIYYHDKDDLIKKLGCELGDRFFDAALTDFHPDMHFADGLKKQWDNRMAYTLANQKETQCYEVIRHSPHGEYVLQQTAKGFGNIMGQFCHNAVLNNELVPVTMEVFWSLAFGPLYNMLRFHAEGKSLGKRAFTMTEAMRDEAFKLVVKALTP